MKKYLLSSLAIAGLMFFTSGAQALDFSKPYVVGEAGYSFGTSNTGDAGILAIGAGYHMNEYFRGDVTVGYRGWGNVKINGKKTDVWSMPVLANLYMTYPIHQRFSVYGMGGLGMAWNKQIQCVMPKGLQNPISHGRLVSVLTTLSMIVYHLI